MREIEASVLDQIDILKESGLDNTKYYKSLTEFFLEEKADNKEIE